MKPLYIHGYSDDGIEFRGACNDEIFPESDTSLIYIRYGDELLVVEARYTGDWLFTPLPDEDGQPPYWPISVTFGRRPDWDVRNLAKDPSFEGNVARHTMVLTIEVPGQVDITVKGI